MTRPLEAWLTRATGLADPDPEALRQWQMAKVRETLAKAKIGCPLFRKSLADIDPDAVRAPEDMALLPRTTARNLREHPESLICVSQDEVARVVTLQSSGTTGPGKRLFFTADDLERTVDYFQYGMELLIEPGQAVLILLPGDRPDSVGRLLEKAVGRMGGRGLLHGPLADPDAALDRIQEQSVACLAGAPAQLNVLAANWTARGLGPEDSPVQSALACWDACPDAVRNNLGRAFGCRTHRHWGMVETSLGGAVECALGSGPHLREADLYVEIADPDTGRLLEDGQWGEITITTLRNRAMPLVRYRSGDQGRILPGRCECQSPLRRLDPDIKRLDADHARGVTLHELNEILYGLDGLADFTTELKTGPESDLLIIRICAAGPDRNKILENATRAVHDLDAVRTGTLRVDLDLLPGPGPAQAGLGKRSLTIRSFEENA